MIDHRSPGIKAIGESKIECLLRGTGRGKTVAEYATEHQILNS